MSLPQWISVKDRLPQEYERVLIYIPQFKDCMVDYVVKFAREDLPYIWGCQLVDEYEKVSHWMALPPPPRGEIDDKTIN